MKQRDPLLLVVDDDPDIAEVICSLGERAGFTTMTSAAPERLGELITHRPDVICLDLQMPGRDGVSALRYLADAKSPARVLLITGMDERTIAAAEQYGMRRGLHVIGTIQKPFDPDALLERFSLAHAALRPLTRSDLQGAIEKDELLLFYQPTVKRFADGSWDIVGVEALLRWDHPVRGLLAPESFLAFGEEHGFGRAMTDFVIQRGIEQLKGWRAARLDIGLRINISAALIADIDFPDRLEAILLEQALDPDVLTLEVTETGMLEQTPETYDILTRLRIKNVNLAIDDFGIGYSSLTQLFRMPFNEMKIDKSLVSKVAESREAFIMVDALVGLAHKLNLTVCAEGVEDKKTLELLDQIGCDAAQGFYISMPLRAAEVPNVAANWSFGRTTTRTESATG
jgi:EAL domain-containing protein (putative c-di-GMP-specific phosphodiesterase class I)/ActR/RegA family two-component response regulator